MFQLIVQEEPWQTGVALLSQVAISRLRRVESADLKDVPEIICFSPFSSVKTFLDGMLGPSFGFAHLLTLERTARVGH